MVLFLGSYEYSMRINYGGASGQNICHDIGNIVAADALVPWHQVICSHNAVVKLLWIESLCLTTILVTK